MQLADSIDTSARRRGVCSAGADSPGLDGGDGYGVNDGKGANGAGIAAGAEEFGIARVADTKTPEPAGWME